MNDSMSDSMNHSPDHPSAPLPGASPAASLSDAQLELLFALRDGELSQDQATRVREQISGSPAMQEVARQLGVLETRAAEIFSPDVFSRKTLAQPNEQPRNPALGQSPSRARLSRLTIFGIAAALFLASALVVLNLPKPLPGISASALHAALVQNDTPEIVCDTPEKFLAYTTEKLGEAITARFDTGVALIGWRGAAEYREDTRKRVLLARAATGEPVLVLFQPKAYPAPTQTNPALHLHKRELGTMTAWEVSSFSQPVVLGALGRANR